MVRVPGSVLIPVPMQKTAESSKQRAGPSFKITTATKNPPPYRVEISSVSSSTITLVTSLFLISMSLSEAKKPYSHILCLKNNKLLTVSKDNSGTEGQ